MNPKPPHCGLTDSALLTVAMAEDCNLNAIKAVARLVESALLKEAVECPTCTYDPYSRKEWPANEPCPTCKDSKRVWIVPCPKEKEV